MNYTVLVFENLFQLRWSPPSLPHGQIYLEAKEA